MKHIKNTYTRVTHLYIRTYNLVDSELTKLSQVGGGSCLLL